MTRHLAADISKTWRTTIWSSKIWGSTIWRKTLALLLLAPLAMAGSAAAHHPTGGRMPANVLDGFLSGIGHPVIGPDHLA